MCLYGHCLQFYSQDRTIHTAELHDKNMTNLVVLVTDDTKQLENMNFAVNNVSSEKHKDTEAAKKFFPHEERLIVHDSYYRSGALIT